MRVQALVRREVFVFLALILATYTIILFFFMFLEPAPLPNFLGFLSLLCYTLTVTPSIVRTVFPATKKSNVLRWIVTNRRQIGVTAFSFGLSHGFLLMLERNLSLSDPHTYIKYFQGISTLLIFTTLAITSSDWSVKILKSNWKKLHQLTYLAIFILPWHILDKMGGHWTRLTPFAVLITTVMVILFIRRKGIEQSEFKRKQEALKQKPSQPKIQQVAKVYNNPN
jgi:sulfoxide reductase heme-binding subunit YedZ